MARTIRREPLVPRESGIAEKPAAFDGEEMAIDPGSGVTGHDWRRE